MKRNSHIAKPSAKPVPLHARDSAPLAVAAAAALAASHYKEATELYKELVKRERNPAWVEALATCYAARAQDLAAKHMFKEALGLWRNRAQACGTPLVDDAYLVWLSNAGEHAEMFRLMHDGALAGSALAALEMRLAPLLLAASDKAMPKLAPDSALLRHRPTALAALAAYQRGDFAAMDDALRELPFRSPYRDLKPILKALALFHRDPAAAPAAVARLPADSVFASMVTLLRSAALPDPQWLAALPALDEHSRHLLLDLKGCPDALRALLLDLAKLGASNAAGMAPAALYDVLLRHRRVLGDAAARLCLRILPHASSRLRRHVDIFGALSAEAQERILALAQELTDGPEMAEVHWKRLANMLAQRAGQQANAALVWRHLADHEERHKDAYDDARDGAALDYLQRSVALDPAQPDTQRRLVQALRASGNARAADAALKLALAHLPNDVALLLAAVQGALDAKAFKKAARLAKQVLELDPINQPVRSLTGQALLSHARKHLKAGTVDAAKKDIAAASAWLRAPADLASMHLLTALIDDTAGAAGNAALRAAARAQGEPLVGAFCLLLEAGRIGRDPRGLLASAGIELADAPGTQAVLALARRLEALPDSATLVRAALLPLHGPLLRAAGGPFSPAELRLLCETFHRYKEATLLAAYAAAALKLWPLCPIFVYYTQLARHGEQLQSMPESDRLALLKAEEYAVAEGDLRTAERIGRLLDEIAVAQGYGDDDIDDIDYFDDIVDEDALAATRALLRSVLASGGDQVFFKMASGLLGKQTVDTLTKQTAGDHEKLVTALIERMVASGPPSMAPRSADGRAPPFWME